MSLIVQDLSFYFDQLHVLDSLSFEITKPEVTAILGPSGSGKSTLLKLLTGILYPKVGRIILDEMTYHDLPGLFGYMDQQGLLLPWRTLKDNLALSYKIKKLPVDRPRITDLIKEFGLGGFENYYPHELSGGMRQRASFLRAFLFSPDRLLLDEPFGALDAMTRTKLWSWFGHFFKTHQTLTLFVTHSIEEALTLASRILVLSPRPGKILMDIKVPFYEENPLKKRNRDDFRDLRNQLEITLGLQEDK